MKLIYFYRYVVTVKSNYCSCNHNLTEIIVSYLIWVIDRLPLQSVTQARLCILYIGHSLCCYTRQVALRRMKPLAVSTECCYNYCVNIALRDVIVLQCNDTMKAKALYANTADTDEELTFKPGDILTVLEQDVAGLVGWWLCSIDNRTGIAPGNRLRLLAESDSSCRSSTKQTTSAPVTSAVTSHSGVNHKPDKVYNALFWSRTACLAI